MARPSWLLATAVNLVVGTFTYAAGFMSSYVLNDLPGADDNLNYLRWGIAGTLLSATVLALLPMRNPGLSWRAVAFAAGTSAAINGTWLALFFGSDVDNLGDDSRTMYGAMPSSTVWSIAVGCAVAALLGLVVAVWTRPRTLTG